VVEAIELLLDAGQWRPAHDLYLNRAGRGDVWQHLPAIRLGQRAATAFVATPARRTACAAYLIPRQLGFYLASTGLFALIAGDLATAGEYLPAAVRHDCDVEDTLNLSIGLMNLADCLGYLGQAGQGRDAAAEALTGAQATRDRELTQEVRVRLGWLAGLAGDAAAAEEQFTVADRMEVTGHHERPHLYGLRGTRWADWLARTGRPGPARALTERNAQICASNGWNDHVARCDRAAGRLALAAADTDAAGSRLAAAAGCFRDGDQIIELADTLPDLADWARTAGDTDAADRHATEAVTIAAPRGLVPAQCAGLAARARIRAAQATAADADPGLVFQGRDAADAALRLAARHHLPWQELDALRAHADLDQAEDVNRGWAAKADALHARLVPPGLDPDPLGTVERLVAEQEATEAGQDKGDY